MRILQNGCFGADVAELQRKLKIADDGWFGAKTENAVKKFQNEKGLEIDGIVGLQTYTALGMIEEKVPMWLVLHCSATPERVEGISAQTIVDYHMRVLKWGRPGYARIIEENGKIVQTWKVNTVDGIQPYEMTYGVGNFGLGAGVDSAALNVCYIGGLSKSGQPKDTRTPEQIASMKEVVFALLKEHPDLKIAGHHQFQNKACPCFSVPKWCREIGVPEKNIYTENPYNYYA